MKLLAYAIIYGLGVIRDGTGIAPPRHDGDEDRWYIPIVNPYNAVTKNVILTWSYTPNVLNTFDVIATYGHIDADIDINSAIVDGFYIEALGATSLITVELKMIETGDFPEVSYVTRDGS